LATVFAFSHDAVIRVYDEAGNVIETLASDSLRFELARLLVRDGDVELCCG
jgi:hypothetical protein